MSFLPAGNVHGTLLNFRREYDALREQMAAPPHRAPPSAPVLYLKPANTWTPHGRAIALPAGADRVWIGATVALVIGPQAPGGAAAQPLDRVAGYVLLNDLSLPQPGLLRPPVRCNCIDGFLGVGPEPLPAAEAGDPADFVLEVRIDGSLRQTVRFADLLRPAAQLLADVRTFMTLQPGDLLMLGCDVQDDGERLTAQAGQQVEIRASGFATLSNTLAAEAHP